MMTVFGAEIILMYIVQCYLGFGYPVGSGYRRFEGIYDQIWGIGGLYSHEG